MTQPNPVGSLAQRLRAETTQAHVSLENAVGFDLHRPSAAAAARMLGNFYRVLAVFEPAMLCLLPARLQERSRLAQLEADLRILGLMPGAEAGGFVPCWIPQTEPEAFGALYVMEGSTLGGKLIAKALRKAADWPLRGQSYFDPYGPQTGAMWASFQDELARIGRSDAEAVIHGANQTFMVLESTFTGETMS